MYDGEKTSCTHLSGERVMELSEVVTSQIYQWMNGPAERKPRIKKKVSVEVVEKAVQVILDYPHWGGKKGRIYMLYHRMALIAEKVYQWVKVAVGWCISGEMKERKLLPEKSSYSHQAPLQVGDVWSADFTDVRVEGVIFYISAVRDDRSLFFLGHEASLGAGQELVLSPLRQSLALTEGKGPKEFLITDRGSQYRCDGYEVALEQAGIKHRLIPPGEPWFNGVAENGMKTLKYHFYRRWYGKQQSQQDSEETAGPASQNKQELLHQVRACVKDVIEELNAVIPCPSLGGVTPQDVHLGIAQEKLSQIRSYMEQEKERIKEEHTTDVGIDRRDVPKLVRKLIDFSAIPADELVILSLLIRGIPLHLFNRFSPGGVS